MCIHLRLRFSILPAEAEASEDLHDAGALPGAEDIVPVLAVEIDRLRDEIDVSESTRHERDPLIMHDAVRRNLRDALRQCTVHHEGTADDVVLHEQLLELTAGRRHLLVGHEARGDLPEFPVDDT